MKSELPKNYMDIKLFKEISYVCKSSVDYHFMVDIILLNVQILLMRSMIYSRDVFMIWIPFNLPI